MKREIEITSLGELLWFETHRQKLGARDIAASLGINKVTVWRTMTTPGKSSSKHLIPIAKFLGIPPDALYELWDGEEKLGIREDNESATL